MKPHDVWQKGTADITASSENESVSFWLKKLYELETQKGSKKAKAPPSPTSLSSLNINHLPTTHTHTVQKTNRSLIAISSVFPWTIFPNTIEVQERQVCVTYRQFMSQQMHSVDIQDISNVFIHTDLFFATLEIVSRTFIENDIKIGFLQAHEAIRVRRIIEGLRALYAHNIDTSAYSINDLITKLEEYHAPQK